MRAYLMTIAGLMAATPGLASSIETDVTIDGDSIRTLSCPTCPPLKYEKRVTYIVPDIAPGTDRTEIREIDGQKKLVRTEAWLGGSPVTFVSKASDAMIAAAAKALDEPETDSAGNTDAPASPPVLSQLQAAANDKDGMITAALPIKASVAESDSTDRSRNFDGQDFQLRLE